MRSPPETVLIVDDDRALARVLKDLLAQDGLASRYAENGRRAMEMIDEEAVDVVLTDVRMPVMDGMALLREIHARWPELPVLMLTAHGSVSMAVEAMRLGAADFILKPFEREGLLYAVKKALTSARPASSAPPREAISPRDLLGESRVIEELGALIRRAAASTATVLVTGESGTGKELVARAIHELGPRREEPFVKIHCAALPDGLLESELFGYEKGAFTGATTSKPGRVELAEGGTLFLDEIGDITPLMQVKLLRLLQDRELERLGGTRTSKVDARFIAATHRDLGAMALRGEFRQDLFYRLCVVPIYVAPLRERREDIGLLARAFCARYGAENHRSNVSLTKSAIARLESEPWPGNVRELQNFIERVVVLTDHAEIGAGDVERELDRGMSGPFGRPGATPGRTSSGATETGAGVRPEDARETLDGIWRETERKALIDALTRAQDNRTVAARLLGVSRRTLYNKLEEHGLGLKSK